MPLFLEGFYTFKGNDISIKHIYMSDENTKMSKENSFVHLYYVISVPDHKY